MCSRTPSAEPKNWMCRSWLTLSGPIEAYCWWPRYQSTLAWAAARNATPAPAKVIFEVDANMSGRLGWPEPDASVMMSALLASSSVRWWKA